MKKPYYIFSLSIHLKFLRLIKFTALRKETKDRKSRAHNKSESDMKMTIHDKETKKKTRIPKISRQR